MDHYMKIEAQNIDIEYVENLLKDSSNFNINNIFVHVQENGSEIHTTLVHHAVDTNNEELLNYLINKSADLNTSILDNFVGTPLHLAVSRKNLWLVKKLHQSGANIDAQIPECFSTPLIEAVRQNHYEIAKYLIENGADVHAVTTISPKSGHTAILIATSEGHNNIAKLLLQNGADPCNEIGLSDIYVSVVKRILTKTPNININSFFICKKSIDHYPTTLLHLAVKYKKKKLIDCLINLNADLNISIPFQGTALHVATKLGDLDLVKKLCESGASVNVQTDEWSKTPLIHAAYAGFFEIAKYLIEKGANVDAVDNHRDFFRGASALQFAVDREHTDIVELLLINNANPTIKDEVGCTPLTIACMNDRLEIMKMLTSHGGIVDTSVLRTAAMYGSFTVLYDFLTLDIDALDIYLMNKKLEDSMLYDILNTLQKQIRFRSANLGNITAILDAGVNVNSVNDNNKLAVEMNVDSKLLDFVKLHIVKLKQAGVYVCQKNIEVVEEGFNDFHTDCSYEVEKLKIDKVGASDLVFFEIMHNSLHYLTIRLKCTGFENNVDKNKLLNVYPIYGGIIYYKLAKVQRRIVLLENVEKFLNCIFNFCLKLPCSFTEKLYYYLTNENLKKLIQ